MWVFTTEGFYSAIKYDEKKWPKRKLAKRLRGVPSEDILCVRARVRGDLVTLLKKLGKNYRIVKVPGDYPYRIFITKEEFEKVMVQEVEEIDYSNFKSAVKDHSRSGSLMDVWSAMIRIEEREPWTKPSSGWTGGWSGSRLGYTDYDDDWDGVGRNVPKVIEPPSYRQPSLTDIMDPADQHEESDRKAVVSRIIGDAEKMMDDDLSILSDDDDDREFLAWLKQNTTGLPSDQLQNNLEGVSTDDFEG